MTGNKKLVKGAARFNPTALGDPVSLKAEQSDTSPTEKDVGAQNPALLRSPHQQQQRGEKGLKQRAEQGLNEARKWNRSMLGDPVSLKAETSAGDPAMDADENEDGTGRSGAASNDKGQGRGKGRDSKL